MSLFSEHRVVLLQPKLRTKISNAWNIIWAELNETHSLSLFTSNTWLIFLSLTPSSFSISFNPVLYYNTTHPFSLMFTLHWDLIGKVIVCWPYSFFYWENKINGILFFQFGIISSCLFLFAFISLILHELLKPVLLILNFTKCSPKQELLFLFIVLLYFKLQNHFLTSFTRLDKLFFKKSKSTF